MFYFTLRFRSCLAALHELGGTLSTKDINVKEDIDLKWILYFWLELRKSLDMFTVSYGATPQLQHNVCEQRWVPNGNLPSEFPLLVHTDFGGFALLFLRGRLGNVKSFIMHVLNYFSGPTCITIGSDNAIQWINCHPADKWWQNKTYYIIHWIEFYPVDSVFHPSNHRSL